MSDPIKLRSRSEITRRDVLRLFAAGAALAKTGCIERTGEEIRPSVHRPETSPGTPRFYATAMAIDGYATGLLVETHAGRPTKLEGNPAHPASRGATTAQHQAAILDLYDPARLRAPEHRGMPATWDGFARDLAQVPGERWIVMPPQRGRTIARLLARRPELRVATWTPIDRAAVYRGTELAFGASLELQLAFAKAGVVVALDADPFGCMPNAVAWSRDFAGRRVSDDDPARLFVAEPMLTPTGSLADHRLPARAGDISAVAIALADALDRHGVAAVGLPQPLRDAARARVDRAWIDRVARELAARSGASVLIAGDRQPAAVHALLHRISYALGNHGTTTTYTAAAPATTNLADLEIAIDGGRVGAVIAVDCDPVHAMPAFAAGLARVPLTARLATHAGAMRAAWQLPLSHFLETWDDARGYDGTAAIVQPAIKPLGDSRSALQLAALLVGERVDDDRALVRAAWPELDDRRWHAALSEGVIPETAEASVPVTPAAGAELVAGLARLAERWAEPGIEIDLMPSPSIGDGRFASNPWLQELSHPITKQAWGNAALMSEATARSLGVDDGDAVSIIASDAMIALPALIAPGHADRCVTVELGYGGPGQIGNVGANAYRLGGPIVRGAIVESTGGHIAIARTQTEFGRHDRETAYLFERSKFVPTLIDREDPPTLLTNDVPAAPLQWGMTIDTTICTGCSSCVVACQAENNTPVVGFDDVARGRDMHWLRIDSYVDGDAIVHQPMMCQHCEHAPCEYVCPTFATTHSPDGLNEMTYNRCIGTRFCSNNCPYKVRRFNWFGYDQPSLAALQRNPDVTVRARGVMEKCTYCVQRIRGAEIRSRVEHREIAPGEVITACQQACPTGAIQFGALEHDTAMTRARKSPRAYATLHDLGTRPRTIYLAKLRDREDT